MSWVALGLDQDAGQDRAHLVARGRASDALDRRLQRRGRKRRLVPLHVGQAREVLGREGAEVKARVAGGQLDVALLRAQLERHVAGRQASRHIGQEPAGQENGSLLLDLSVSERQRDPHLHVGRPKEESLGGRIEEDAAERRQRRSG